MLQTQTHFKYTLCVYHKMVNGDADPPSCTNREKKTRIDTFYLYWNFTTHIWNVFHHVLHQAPFVAVLFSFFLLLPFNFSIRLFCFMVVRLFSIQLLHNALWISPISSNQRYNLRILLGILFLKHFQYIWQSNIFLGNCI